jgi:hypothetical protein
MITALLIAACLVALYSKGALRFEREERPGKTRQGIVVAIKDWPEVALIAVTLLVIFLVNLGRSNG